MVKIVFLIRKAEGGMAGHVIDLILGLDRSRYDPVLIKPRGGREADARLDSSGVLVYEADYPDRPNPINDAAAARRIAVLFNRLKPDVIHIHGHMAAAVGTAALSLLAEKPPIVITVHNYPSYREGGTLKRRSGAVIQRMISRRSTVMIAVSEDIRRHMVQEEGVDPEKIVTVHNGIDVADIDKEVNRAQLDEFRNLIGVDPGLKVVGASGRLVGFKGFSVLCEATAILKEKRDDFVTVIAGRGPEEENLRARAAGLGLGETFKMAGYLPELRHFFALADVFTVPSLLEPFGLIVLEAMAAARPVIGANAGGIPEIIQNGRTGLLVPAGDPEALAGAIDRTLDDGEGARRLGAAAREDVRSRFTLDNMVRATQTVYETALSANV